MKYTLSYSFNEGVQGGILGTTGREKLTKEEVIKEIGRHVFSKGWSRWLKEINISIKKTGK